MCHFMTHDHSNSVFIFTYRKNSSIEGNFSSWHTPGVYRFVILYQIEFPIESFQLTAPPLKSHVSFHSSLNALAYTPNHLGLLNIVRERTFLDYFLILCSRHRINLRTGNQIKLSTAC